MKLWNLIALSAILAITLPLFAHAQFAYVTTSVSITSTTVPVAVIPSTDLKSTWMIKPRSTAVVPVLCFTYSGALPGSAPANCSSPGSGAGCTELVASQPMSDGQNFYSEANGNFQTALNQGVACVLSTGSSAVTVDGKYR